MIGKENPVNQSIKSGGRRVHHRRSSASSIHQSIRRKQPISRVRQPDPPRVRHTLRQRRTRAHPSHEETHLAPLRSLAQSLPSPKAPAKRAARDTQGDDRVFLRTGESSDMNRRRLDTREKPSRKGKGETEWPKTARRTKLTEARHAAPPRHQQWCRRCCSRRGGP